MGNRNNGRGAARLAEAPPAGDGFSLISDEKLLALYTSLLKCRTIEQDTRKKQQSNGHRPTVWRCEAGLVATVIDLRTEDAVVLSDRLVRDFSGRSPIDRLLSSTNGGPGRTPSDSLHAAMGAALANKTKMNRNIVVVFGDRGLSHGWDEALKIAGVHSLPIIFLSHADEKPAQTRRSRPAATPESLSFPSITVDRDDVVAVYRVASEAISRARQGRGATLIECLPFRLHGTPSVNQYTNGNYRHVHDPVHNMENYLRSKGLFPRG